MTDKGTGDKIKGKAKEVAGDVTGNDKMKAEGMFDQALGKVKEVAADAKDKVEEVSKEIKNKLDK
ncbi:CsbD family protein [Enterococcus sp.]|uniref:CsbD family protein n=1 Tax=Enterococcus sp. TaxID=35783 RepID=UPI002FCB2097